MQSSAEIGTGLSIFPIQCKLARVALNWGVRDLAQKADVSASTVARFERGDRLLPRTVLTLRQALEAGGIEFIGEADGKGPGLRFRQPFPAESEG
ncbi:helix-turn-helix domain-containing protein [Azospirillum baldaniorum]|uniref:HTH cro/C1-type domain-containing protein n=1 Tax=Azospirillum baldaniorum TaxID=1064539 RepID=A0A9P1JQU0_9PROT|nr:helix-turn-helix transcriptional regulator [Azospirillum baldaniorum]CCC98010.1 conserved protein of unknown function [Azospirillum baldaniorum]